MWRKSDGDRNRAGFCCNFPQTGKEFAVSGVDTIKDADGNGDPGDPVCSEGVNAVCANDIFIRHFCSSNVVSTHTVYNIHAFAGMSTVIYPS